MVGVLSTAVKVVWLVVGLVVGVLILGAIWGAIITEVFKWRPK